MEQRIRFCTTPDGVRLAYATHGKGPPLVKAANWLTHLEFDWQSPIWRHWLEQLGRGHTFVRYDERGCGLSDWQAEDLSLDSWLRDLEIVVDAAELDRFALLGISQGGAIALTYAVRHPERVSHLVLVGAYARGRLRRDPSAQTRDEADMMLSLIRVGWGQPSPAFRRVFSELLVPGGTSEQLEWFDELARTSTSPAMAERLERSWYQIDVTDVLSQVAVPTLVVHAREDATVPFAEGRLLATRIPGARFLPLDSKNHILLADEPAWPVFLAGAAGSWARSSRPKATTCRSSARARSRCSSSSPPASATRRSPTTSTSASARSSVTCRTCTQSFGSPARPRARPPRRASRGPGPRARHGLRRSRQPGWPGWAVPPMPGVALPPTLGA